MNRPDHTFPLGRRLVAALVLAHLLATLALAASPRLHHWVHPDEDDDDGDCSVVLFLHGATGDVASGSMTVAGFVAVCAILFVARTEPSAFVPSVFFRSRVFEHAPPVSL